MYIDDCLMFAKTADIIENLIASLRTEFTLTDEGDVNGFLGIDVKNLSDGSYELTQPGFIDRIIKEVGLEDELKEHTTPAVSKLLSKDEDGYLKATSYTGLYYKPECREMA